MLQKYSINHEEVDFMKHQIDRPHDHLWLGWYEKLRFRFQIAYSKYISTGILALISVGLAWLIVFYAYPARLVAH
jgi:hypothetical protein